MIKVVIVDDNQDACELLKNKIEDLTDDFKVIALFTESKAFLSAKPKLEYDVLFLDIEMPGFNGFELHRKESKPVIFVTANAPQNIEGISAAGNQSGTTFLTKPLNKDSLLFDALNNVREKVSDKITVKFKTSNGVAIINVADLQLICSPKLEIAKDKGSNDPRDKILFAKDSEPLILRQITLVELVARLPQSIFFQISSQVIVSKRYMKTFRVRGLDLQVYDGKKTEFIPFEIGDAVEFKERFKQLVSG